MLVAGISTTASGPRSADVARMAREAHEADQSVVVLAAESRHECDETRAGKVNAGVGSAAQAKLRKRRSFESWQGCRKLRDLPEFAG